MFIAELVYVLFTCKDLYIGNLEFEDTKFVANAYKGLFIS